MCGIAAMFGPGVSTADLEFYRDLSYIIGLRGQDSSGIFQGAVYRRHVTYQLTKESVDINTLMQFIKHEKKDWLNSTIHNFFVTHARAATRGAVTKENSHPFDLEHIVGVHNGTLYDSKYQDKEYTDSELFFEDIQERGVEKVLQELNPKSAYAFIYFDKRTNEFVIARNTERPLVCCFNRDRRVFYVASETWMLTVNAARNGIKIGDTFDFTPGLIHRFTPLDVRQNNTPDWDIKKIPEPENPQVLPRLPWQKADVDTAPVFPIRQSTPIRSEPEAATPMEKKTPNILSWPEGLSRFRAQAPEPVAEITETKRSKKEHLKSCINCGKELDLLEQHRGYECSPGQYLCQVCDHVGFIHEQPVTNYIQ